MYTDQKKHRALAPVYFTRILLLGVLLSLIAPALFAADPEIFPLSQVKPGMKGEALTIFAGDQIEKFDLVVIGVMPNFLGPKESIILVQLLGPKVEHTGVVAGMSGSPVYFDGKLAGALSLKVGIFTKDAIGGVTPIENMLDVEKSSAAPAVTPAGAPTGAMASATLAPLQARVPIPENFITRTSVGAGQFLVPIETPLISSGLYPETLA